MPLPGTQEIRRPLLEAFKGEAPRNFSINEILEIIAEYYGLNLNDFSSGDKNIFKSSINEAKSYLKRNNLLYNPSGNTYMITNAGKEILEDNPEIISDEYLKSRRKNQLPLPETLGAEPVMTETEAVIEDAADDTVSDGQEIALNDETNDTEISPDFETAPNDDVLNDTEILTDNETSTPQDTSQEVETFTDNETSTPQDTLSEIETFNDTETSPNFETDTESETLTDNETPATQDTPQEVDTLTDTETSTSQDTPSEIETLTDTETSPDFETDTESETLTDNETLTPQDSQPEFETFNDTETSPDFETDTESETLTDNETSTSQDTPQEVDAMTDTETSPDFDVDSESETLTDNETSETQDIPQEVDTLTDNETSTPQDTPQEVDAMTDTETSPDFEADTELKTLTDNETSTSQDSQPEIDALPDNETSTPQDTLPENDSFTDETQSEDFAGQEFDNAPEEILDTEEVYTDPMPDIYEPEETQEDLTPETEPQPESVHEPEEDFNPELLAAIPSNTIDDAIARYNSELADELLMKTAGLPADRFEMLVIDLLSKMGYFAFQTARYTTESSGSDLIHGVILDNKTGANIYIQARKLSPGRTVSKADIQDFVDELSDKGGKGLYATTANFSENAKILAADERLMLIDGEKLANLMIANNFCVNVEKVYEVKAIDTESFSEYE